MRLQGIRDVDLFRKHGVAQSTVSRWRSGSLPRRATMIALADALNVNRKWLMTGTGDMTPGGAMTDGMRLSEPKAPMDYRATYFSLARQRSLDSLTEEMGRYFKLRGDSTDETAKEEMASHLRELFEIIIEKTS